MEFLHQVDPILTLGAASLLHLVRTQELQRVKGTKGVNTQRSQAEERFTWNPISSVRILARYIHVGLRISIEYIYHKILPCDT